MTTQWRVAVYIIIYDVSSNSTCAATLKPAPKQLLHSLTHHMLLPHHNSPCATFIIVAFCAAKCCGLSTI
jgi:hypothetical protein